MTNGLLVALCALGALSAAALVLEPRSIWGQSRPAGLDPRPVAAAKGPHQALIDKLAALIEQSVGVLGIHHRGSGPYEEIVLWVDDDMPGSQGRAEEREIAVVSHSLLMRTVTIYRIAAAGEPDRRARLGSLEFCEALRADRRCGTLVVASGVADMRVESIGPTRKEGAPGASGDLSPLRLTLTWAPDSADGADEASVLVNTVLFSSPTE